MSQQSPSLPMTAPLPVPVKKLSNIVFNDMPVGIIAGSLWGISLSLLLFLPLQK